MKTASCLILDKSDLTRAGALKPAAFAAFSTHDVVIAPTGVVMKCSTPASSKPNHTRTPRPARAPREAPTP